MQNKQEHTELEHVWSVISHDLTSPLSVIHNNLKHLDKDLLPMLLDTYKIAKAAGLEVPIIRSNQLESYQKILGTTQSITDNVRQQIARWNRKLLLKHFKSTIKPIEIVKCVKEAIENYQTSYSLKDKSLIHVDIDEAILLGDEDLIQYIIFELLTNAEYAIEANANENPAVFISSEMDDKHYYLKIKNESSSGAAADLNQWFDPYFSTKMSHIGLGLTFCKQAMDHMQGDISCHAENEGRMVVFVLTFLINK
jgi:two-component system CAI-1 autoinducer sensor kinase/phosphatase CqsS